MYENHVGQMTLFELFSSEPEQTIPVQKKAEPVKQPAKGSLPKVAPLCFETPFSEWSLKWISYSLAKIETPTEDIYSLILPVESADEAYEHIREALPLAGIDPYKTWAEQGVGMLKARQTYGQDEMKVYRGFGKAGNIYGGYAIRPVCPVCAMDSNITNVVISENAFERYCTVEMDCGHKCLAAMVFLPGYQYAQHVFEAFTI